MIERVLKWYHRVFRKEDLQLTVVEEKMTTGEAKALILLLASEVFSGVVILLAVW